MRGTKFLQTIEFFEKLPCFKKYFFMFIDNVQMRKPFISANGEPLIHRAEHGPPCLAAARSHSGKNNTPCCFLRPSCRFATHRRRHNYLLYKSQISFIKSLKNPQKRVKNGTLWHLLAPYGTFFSFIIQTRTFEINKKKVKNETR